MKFTDKEKEQLAKTLLAEYDRAEQVLFITFCERTGLDPFSKQVYAQKRGGKLVIVTSIDGLRAIAQRSGEYTGQTAPQWSNGTAWTDVWLHSNQPPAACKVGVYRKGFAEPLYAVVSMAEFGGSGQMWNKMPAHMLAIRAEALAMRKAFPNETSGLVADVELDSHEAPPIQPEQPKEHVSSRADSIRSKIPGLVSGADIKEPEAKGPVFFDAEDASWLRNSLSTVGASLDELRTVMGGVNDIDKTPLPLEPEGNWPLSWRGRIDKWLKKVAKEERSHEVPDEAAATE